jgi:hypothetical protein
MIVVLPSPSRNSAHHLHNGPNSKVPDRLAASLIFNSVRCQRSAATEPARGERGDAQAHPDAQAEHVAATEPARGERGDAQAHPDAQAEHVAATEPARGERGDDRE